MLAETSNHRQATAQKWLLAAGATLLMTGCQRGASYEEVYRDLVKNRRDIVAVLKGIRDQESMEKARPELRKLQWHSQALAKRFKALSAPSQETEREIEIEFAPALQQAMQEMQHEASRIKELSGGEEFLNRLKSL